MPLHSYDDLEDDHDVGFQMPDNLSYGKHETKKKMKRWEVYEVLVIDSEGRIHHLK